MTLGELKEAVALLGFENSLSDIDDTAERHFLFCANRALWTVCKLRPRSAIYELVHFPPQNMIGTTFYQKKGGVDIKIDIFGAKAYTFWVSGSGSVSIIDNGKETVYHWSQARILRGFLEGGETSLVFKGEYGYVIRSLAFYDHMPCAQVADIPDGTDAVSYDISKLAPDFAFLKEPPILAPENSWLVHDRRILLLRRQDVGVYEVHYLKKPCLIEENTAENADLGLDEDLCQLLPLLCATYLCLEDAPDKSSYYYSLYKEQYRLIEAAQHSHTRASWASSNGW